jgi:hypothetical protein
MRPTTIPSIISDDEHHDTTIPYDDGVQHPHLLFCSRSLYGVAIVTPPRGYSHLAQAYAFLYASFNTFIVADPQERDRIDR